MIEEEVLKAIRFPKKYSYPYEATKEIRDNQDLYISEFIAMLEEICREPDTFDQERFDLVIAFYLLGEFKAKEAFPVMIKVLSISGINPEIFFGDLITEDLQRVLASVYDANHEDLLVNLILNSETDSFVVSSALNALIILLSIGQFSREKLISLLKQVISTHKSADLIAFASISSSEAGIVEVFDTIHQALEDKRLDISVISENEMKEELSFSSKASIMQLKKTNYFRLIDNADETLERWSFFTPHSRVKDSGLFESYYKLMENSTRKMQPVTNPYKNVGRNEPCPCGSGKKFKRCCGR